MSSEWTTVFTFESILLLYFFYQQFKVHKLFLSRNNPEDLSSTLDLSIVISLRNEENNISESVGAIQLNNYPASSYEIILVNDYSTDNTLKVISELSRSHSNIKVMNNEGTPGKRSALSIGIQSARSDYIIITDGDCKPEQNWLRAFNQKFLQGYDFIFGLAPFSPPGNLVQKIASFENMKSGLLSLVSLLNNAPHTATARSMGFTRDAFSKCGGYSKTSQTISGDDDLLLREMSRNKLKVGFLDIRNSRVFSQAKVKFSDYLYQKSRHTTTSFHYSMRHKLFLILWHSPQIIFQFSFIFAFINPTFLIVTLIKSFYELLVSSRFSSSFSYKYDFFEKLALPFIYEFLLIINLISAKTLPKKWK